MMVVEVVPRDQRRVHIRFEGRSWDIAFDLLGIGEQTGDQDVRLALARYFDVPTVALDRYVVEKHANGNITVRPEAVFG